MKRLFDKDTWQEIFGSIQKNKIRTIITMIGVLWGIFIYIILYCLGAPHNIHHFNQAHLQLVDLLVTLEILVGAINAVEST